jgi:Kyakuja-Dileera-Zisupton transposase
MAAMHRKLESDMYKHHLSAYMVHPNRHVIKRMMVHFTCLLGRASPAHMMCPHCGLHPRAFIFDGTAKGPHHQGCSDLARNTELVYQVPTPGLKTAISTGIFSADISYACCQAEAALLRKKDSSGLHAALRDAVEFKGFEGVPECDKAIVRPIFEALSSGAIPVKERLNVLLLMDSLGKRSIAVSVFNMAHITHDLLGRLLANETITPAFREVLKPHLPELADALANKGRLPDHYRPLVERLQALALQQVKRAFGNAAVQATRTSVEAPIRTSVLRVKLDAGTALGLSDEELDEKRPTQDVELSRGRIFALHLGRPYIPAVQHVPQVQGAKATTTRQHEDADPQECDHNFRLDSDMYTSYTGIICCEHGYVYGAFISPKHESLTMFYQLIVSYLLPTIQYNADNGRGTVFIYDSACQLWNYINKRWPALASCILPRVDKFHSKNHKSCTSGFLLRHYKDKASQEYNSSGAEQVNSRLQKLGIIMAYSTGVHATMLLERFIAYWNHTKASYDGALPVTEAWDAWFESGCKGISPAGREEPALAASLSESLEEEEGHSGDESDEASDRGEDDSDDEQGSEEEGEASLEGAAGRDDIGDQPGPISGFKRGRGALDGGDASQQEGEKRQRADQSDSD